MKQNERLDSILRLSTVGFDKILNNFAESESSRSRIWSKVHLHCFVIRKKIEKKEDCVCGHTHCSEVKLLKL